MIAFTVTWSVGTLAAWSVLWAIFRRRSIFASQPAYAAFNLVNMIPISALSYFGFVGRRDWYVDAELSVQGRMYLYDPISEKIALLQIALQIYTTTASVVMGDEALLKPELLAHHIVTALLMCVCLHPFVNSRCVRSSAA